MSAVVVAGALVAGAGAAFAACQPQSVAPPTVAGGHNDMGGSGETDAATTVTVDSGIPPITATTVTLATGVVAPQAIVLDPDHVYWTTSQRVGQPLVGDASAGSGSVGSVPRAGGSVVDLVAGLSSPTDLAIAGSTLFFSQGSSTSGFLDAYTLDATAIVRLATGPSSALPMLVNDGLLYWASGDGAHLNVQAIPTTGGSVASVASTSGAYAPQAVATNGSSLVILANGSDGEDVVSIPLAGGAATVLWHEAGVQAVDLVVAGDAVYWSIANTASNGGEILSIPVGGGTTLTIASGLASPAGLAVQVPTLYFTSHEASGAVLAVSTGGGAITTLASGLEYPGPLAIDDAVYVGTVSAVVRVAK